MGEERGFERVTYGYLSVLQIAFALYDEACYKKLHVLEENEQGRLKFCSYLWINHLSKAK